MGTYLQQALDAVVDPGTGNIVCRGVLNNDPAAAGCSPLNLFGANNASTAGIDYAFRTLEEYSTLKQYVLSANIHGNLSDRASAPARLQAAFGLEARRDTADVTHDLANQPWYTSYFLSYGLDYAGKISVLEGYGEVNVPVLKDLPLAKSLELDGAIPRNQEQEQRPTVGASTYGESISHNIPSWKLSGIWDLNDWFRVRATRSRDVRAAGFRELYESYAVTAGGPFGTITNPVNNQSQIVTALTGGNIDLSPEKADTTTAGFVISPKSGAVERLPVLRGLVPDRAEGSDHGPAVWPGRAEHREPVLRRGSRRSAIASRSVRRAISARSPPSTTRR